MRNRPAENEPPLSSSGLPEDGIWGAFRLRAFQYAAAGGALGVLVLGGCWVFELGRLDEGISFGAIARIHRETPLLYPLLLVPLVLALGGAWAGRLKDRLRASYARLEDRVRERTAEAVLEKARTAAILDSAADGIVTFEASGKITGYNHAAECLFGYEPAAVLGRDVRAILPQLEREEDVSWMTGLERVRQQFSGEGKEIEGLRSDGTTVPVEVELSRFDLGGETIYTGIIHDLTERKKAELLRQSLLQVSEAINRAENLDALFPTIRSALGQVVAVENFCIALVEGEEEQLNLVYTVGEEGEAAPHHKELMRVLLGRVMERGEPLLAGPEEYRQLREEGVLTGPEIPWLSWLGVPLVHRGKRLGAMAVLALAEGASYSIKDVWTFNVVSAQIASAIARERARESLRRSERRYRRMVEEAGEIVYTTDLRGHFTYANPPITRLTGYAEEELIGRHSSMLLEEEWASRIRSFYLRQIRHREKETVLEFPILTKEGGRRWLSQKTTLLFENDRPSGFQSVVHDITERRAAEAALREREERFRSLSASSPIGIFQVNEHGSCIYTNRRFQEITGLSLEACLGDGWLEAIEPNARAALVEHWRSHTPGNAPASREVMVQTVSGETRWVNVRWAPTWGPNQQLTGYVGTFEDITARKRTERLNQTLYEISEAVQTTEDLHEFFEKIHRSLSPIIDTSNLYIATYNPETRMISFPYAREDDQQDMHLRERPVDQGLTGYVIRTGKHLLLDEDGLEEMYSSGKAQLIGKLAKNWLGVPLVSKGEVIGAVILQSYIDRSHYTESDVQTMNFVSSQIASAIERKQAEEESRLYTEQLAQAHSRIKQDLEMAARIQQARLPRRAPDVPGFEFAWLFDACEEIAGDMFNFIRLDEHRLGVYILDVSGHGIPAALLSMSLSRSLTAATDGSGVLLREGASGMEPASPAEVAGRMNRRYPMSAETNQYFTMLYGILDLREHTFTFSRGGHPAPILVNRNGAHELDQALGPAIGILPNASFTETTVRLAPGDRLFLFTDGVDEAANNLGEEFGLPRILEALAEESSNGGGVQEQVRHLRRKVHDFGERLRQEDDITIVAIHYTGESSGLRALPTEVRAERLA